MIKVEEVFIKKCTEIAGDTVFSATELRDSFIIQKWLSVQVVSSIVHQLFRVGTMDLPSGTSAHKMKTLFFAMVYESLVKARVIYTSRT